MTLALQLPMFEPSSSWKATPVAQLPEWPTNGRIAIDVETCDLELRKLGIGVRRGGFIVGVSFAIEGGPMHYLPFRHKGGDNLPEAEVLRYLREQAKRFHGEYVGANLSYDLDYLWEEGIISDHATYLDIQVADPLIYELHLSYSLKNIGLRYGIEAKDEHQLEQAAAVWKLDPKKDLWKLPARHVGAYAERDVTGPLEIMRAQEKKIEKEGLQKIWKLERSVTPVLVRMTRRGVRVDLDKLDKIERWTHEQETALLGEVHRETGVHIAPGSIWKAEALAPALEHQGFVLERTSKGAPSIDGAQLERSGNVVAGMIVKARKINKLRTTFAAGVRKHIIGDRLHCNFKQIAQEDEYGNRKGVRYGRLSAVSPNIQQQPSRDEFAKMWRSIYVAEQGAIWGCNDYSQQEPRWTTHFAAVTNQEGAVAAAKEYRENPDLDNHTFMAETTGLDRSPAKIIYLGLCYGEGGFKLCQDLGLPTRYAFGRMKDDGRGRRRWATDYYEKRHTAMAMRAAEGDGRIWPCAGLEGQAIIDKFDQRAPFIRALAKYAQKIAERRGFIRTIMGRRLNFELMQDGSYDGTRRALNRLIQGSSGDQTKLAMVEIDREMPDTFINMQVHDELDGSFEDEKSARRVGEIMMNVISDAEVPFRVDTECGPSWGELKDIE